MDEWDEFYGSGESLCPPEGHFSWSASCSRSPPPSPMRGGGKEVPRPGVRGNKNPAFCLEASVLLTVKVAGRGRRWRRNG